MVLDRVNTNLDCLIRNFVINAVYMVCKNHFSYNKIKVEGTLGITVDEGQIVFIHLSDTHTITAEDSANATTQVTSTPDVTTNQTEVEEVVRTKLEVTQAEQSSNVGTTDELDIDQLRAIKQELNNSSLLGIAAFNGDYEEEEEEDDLRDIKTTVINPDPYLVNMPRHQEELSPETSDNYQSDSPYFDGFKEPMHFNEESDLDDDDEDGGSDFHANYVIACLEKCSEGQQVLKEYKETGQITAKTRSLLIRILVRFAFEMKSNLYPKSTEKMKLAKNIIQAFPCLKGDGVLGYEYFFTPYIRNTCHNGKKKGKPAHGSIEERLKSLRKGKRRTIDFDPHKLKYLNGT